MTTLRSLILMLAATSVAEAEAPLWAILKEKAAVRGLNFVLSDIATVDGLDEEVVRRLKNLSLGPTPAGDRTRLLMRETIEGLIRAADPSFAAAVVRGASACQIATETITLSSEEVQLLARRFVVDNLGSSSADVRLASSMRPAPLTTAVGHFSLRFDVVPPSADRPLAGLVRFNVRAIVDGQPGEKTVVELAIERAVSVVVATESLPAGKPIDPEKLHMERRTHTLLEAPLDRVESVRGLIPKGRIPAGQELRANDFIKPPVVFRNDPVQIELVAGSLTIRSEGLALADGAPGERIAVRTGAKKAVVQAIVIDSRTVRVEDLGRSRP